MSEVTRLIDAACGGDRQAAADLLPLGYDELRRLAAARMTDEGPGHTLQPTALVHEAFLRLIGPADADRWDHRGHFFAAAAEAMRRVLVDHARRRDREKRGGGRPGSLGRIVHYEVVEVLGRGGFGVVFRAFDDVLQRVVAVEVLAPSLAVTSPARKRFLREARGSAPIQHENVVRVHEVGEHPLPYLVMEFVRGETLQQLVDRTGPLDAADVLRIGQQVAAGLAAAHATGADPPGRQAVQHPDRRRPAAARQADRLRAGPGGR